MSRVLYLLVFALGLAVIGWVGAGYMGANLLALAVTGLIALAYLFGGLELLRFGQATASLSRALDNLKNATPSLTGTASETTAAAVNTALTAAEGASSSTTPAITIHALDAWFSKLDPSLRDAVRMRVEGERVGLPAPSLTPYLVGLLVLLGMLGTFLGMVATLRGTGLALEHATDLQAIRASLAAPVKGLGFAFGTSVAGVAASAMLGLLAALCRRDRVRVAQRLDAAIAGVLRVFSKSHQRDESFKQMQQHAQALPLVAERLQTMIESLEKRSLEADEKLEQRSLSFLEQAQQRGQEIDQQFQERGLAVDKQLQQRGLAVDEQFQQRSVALIEQLQQNASRLDEGLEHRTDRLHQRLEERAAALDEQLQQKNNLLFQRLEESSAAQNQRLAAEQEAFHAKMSELYTELTSSVQRSLSESMSQAGSAVSAAIQPAFESTLAGLSQQAGTLQQSVEQLMQQQIQAFSTQFEQSTNKVADIWVDALAEHRRTSESLIHEQRQASESLIQQSQSESLSLIEEIRRTGEAQAQTQTKASESLASDLRGTLGAFAETFEQRSAALVDNVASKLEGTTASLGQAWADTFTTLAASLREEWAQATASTLSSQQELSNTFTQATSDMAAQMREQADSFTQRTQQQVDDFTQRAQQQTNDFTQRTQQQADDFTQRTQQQAADTIAQVEQLVKAASDAPKMASEVIAQMREKLSESLVRDNAMLEERGRLLETLGTLLDAVNQASNEQRTTVDALLNNTSNLLDRIGSQVTDKVETEASKLGYMASQVTESAIQVAELGDTFGKAVESFRESNTSLADHLQRLEQALDNSLTRSDEQLAYYVAQAREVVDLSMLSQKQILEELQQVGGLQANGGAKTA